MWWKRKYALGLALLLGGAVAVQADSIVPVKPVASDNSAKVVTTEVMPVSNVVIMPEVMMGQASRQDEEATTDTPVGDEQAPKFGPTMPEDVKILMDSRPGDFLADHGARIYGWTNMGYTYSSSGPGFLAVEPRENAWGNEFLLNQTALRLERPLKTDEFSLGYDVLFYAGADAALLRPKGGFTTTNTHFGADFRHLNVAAHLPVLSDGGVDVKVGRMGTVVGFESAMAPYRPFYSNDYQWFYAQDGAWTGVYTNWHVNKQLDVINCITLGANTFFTLRGNGPCYLGQINYWLQEEKKTLLSASAHIGNQAIFTAPNFIPGDNITMIEMRVQQNWSPQFYQVVQSDDGWETGMPGLGTGEFYSLYNIFVYSLTKKFDLTNRVEWFDDVEGTRTGFKAHYSEITLGCDYHPCPALRLRPEIRGDFADHNVFGGGGRAGSDNAQLTIGVEALLQY